MIVILSVHTVNDFAKRNQGYSADSFAAQMLNSAELSISFYETNS
jgi:hypothetical protein